MTYEHSKTDEDERRRFLEWAIQERTRQDREIMESMIRRQTFEQAITFMVSVTSSTISSLLLGIFRHDLGVSNETDEVKP